MNINIIIFSNIIWYMNSFNRCQFIAVVAVQVAIAAFGLLSNNVGDVMLAVKNAPAQAAAFAKLVVPVGTLIAGAVHGTKVIFLYFYYRTQNEPNLLFIGGLIGGTGHTIVEFDDDHVIETNY